MKLTPYAILVATIALSPLPASACASCGCTLSSDWEDLHFGRTGLTFDLRYDYLNQNRLRSGTAGISPEAASRRVTDGDPQEVEKFTRNRYLTLTADYGINQDWGVNLQLPYVLRTHDTLGTASDGVTAGPGGGQYESDISAVGDVRIIGRYQGFVEEHGIGLLFGAKLPTGSHTLTGISTDPTAPGSAPIDRGLQPGTGTTDLILGAYQAGSLVHGWDYFVQGLYQAALNSKDDYRPGNGMNLNVGVRYTGMRDNVIPEIQINARHVNPDSGVNADTVSTGGTLANLSPGVVIPIDERASVYGFVQVPLYQNVRGVQLTPHYAISIGARFSY
jgi:hypothetical protein